MMQTSEPPRSGWSVWLRGLLEAHAGWLVLVIVLVLLEGPSGTCVALKSQAGQFLHTFLGSDQNEITSVATRTLPLVLATAVMTFLLLRRWLPEGMGGVYLTAIVIVSTGWLARELSTPADHQIANSLLTPAIADTSSPLARLLPDDLPGVIGLVVRAASELSNYLWQYGWNLSAAALVVGAFVGWKLHRRLGVVEKGVETVRTHWKRAA
jgi:hypothetical protein